MFMPDQAWDHLQQWHKDSHPSIPPEWAGFSFSDLPGSSPLSPTPLPTTDSLYLYRLQSYEGLKLRISQEDFNLLGFQQ